MNPEQLTHYAAQATSLVSKRAPTVLGGIVTLVIGLRAIKRANKLITKAFQKSNIDITVSKFMSNLISVGLKVLLFISVAGMFGVQTTSFIAILGAAGLAVGLSLQGSLANFAGGVLILLFKPYKIGDLIDIQGIKGHVTEIGILNTTLTTLDNNTAIIPNGPIINDNIVNLTTKDSIRVDVGVGIGYNEDIDQAKKALQTVIDENQHIIDHPGNGVFVNELADSSVNLIVRGYAKPEHYRPAYFALTEHTKKALDAAEIEIPYPQMVMHNS